MRTLGLAAAAACFLVGWPGIGTAGAQSACAELGGTVEPDQTCHVDDATSDYTLDLRFPVSYADQQPVTDSLTQRRDEFSSWVAESPPRDRTHPYELDIVGKEYQSSTPTSGTQSLVLDIWSDTGAHPVISYKAFNYDLGKRGPITFDTLFKPGAKPLDVLTPIVQRELEKRSGASVTPLNDPDVDAYQNFAITDDAVIFFFGQGQILPQVAGPQEVSVPRAELAPLLA